MMAASNGFVVPTLSGNPPRPRDCDAVRMKKGNHYESPCYSGDRCGESSVAAICLAESPSFTFKKLRSATSSTAEGAYYADFNKDGNLDIVAGPYWYEGPDFQKKHEIRPPKAYDPKGYSDNFLTFTGDFNGDGWPDMLYVPFPGGEAYWYENPAGKDRPWKKHLALKDVGNESPMWADINGDGRPELIYNIDGYMGYATYDPAKPDEPWVFHPITPKGNTATPTASATATSTATAGSISSKRGWWEQPADAKPGEPWIRHPFYFADAAAQMLVYDVDGDGLADVITVWHCHQYGLVWYKQVRDAKGEITWQQHEILSPKPDLKSNALRISELHAMDLVDINGDGLKDILTGKRFWAHGPKGDVEPNAPAVVYWFEFGATRKGVEFIPHLIDDNSGVGTQVTAVDLNGDGIADVIVGNKKGTFVLLSQPAK